MSQGGIAGFEGTSVTETLTGNSGGAVPPTGNNINVVGDGTTITVAGNPGTSTLTISAIGSGLVDTLTGNTGGAISPVAGNINTVGTGSITIAGAGNTLTTQLTGLTNHNVLVGAGTATITSVAPSTAGFVLTSNGAAADPSFQAVSASGAITTITGNSGGAEVPTAGGNFNIVGTGSITVAGSANTETVQLTGLTNHSLLVGAGTATITNLGVATNGQLPIGSTGADPVLATLTAGTGISITNGAGSITVASTGSPMAWTDEAVSFNAAAGNGYFITAGSVVATLPASPTQGQTIAFVVDTTSTFEILANTGQLIRLGTQLSAAAGNAVNTQRGDSIQLVYRSTGTTWFAQNAVGGWNIT